MRAEPFIIKFSLFHLKVEKPDSISTGRTLCPLHFKVSQYERIKKFSEKIKVCGILDNI